MDAADLARVAAVLGDAAHPPPRPPREDDMPYSPEELTQYAASGFARAAKTELLKVGDGPEDTPTELTLERWAKVTNDRLWALEQESRPSNLPGQPTSTLNPHSRARPVRAAEEGAQQQGEGPGHGAHAALPVVRR